MAEEVLQEEQQVQTPQEPRLSEENRAKLNSIIAQMKDNNESEEAIVEMVSQFKAKYLPKPTQSKTEQPKPSKQSEQAFESRQQPWSTPQGQQPKQEQPKKKKRDPYQNVFNGEGENVKTEKKSPDKPIELIPFNKRVSSEQTVLAPIQQEAEFEITIRDQKKVELAKKAEEANKRLTQELASEGIPAVKKFLEKQRKDAAFQAANNVVTSRGGDMGYMQSHIDNMRNAIAKENLQLMPEVNEMTANAAMQQLSQTPQGQRTILKAYVDANPTKAKEVEANQYAVDANNRENDPVKVMSNIDRIKSGELVYDVQNGILKKPVSFVEGWKEAMKEGEKEIKGYEKFSQMSNKEAVAALDQLLDRDADDYVVEVNGLGGWAGQTIGSFTNEAALAVSASAASAPIAGPFAPLVGAAATSKMVYERAWFQNYVRTYSELVEEGRMSKEAAEKKAREVADNSAMIDTAVNVGTEAIGLGAINKSIKAMSKGSKRLIGKEMIDNAEEVAKKTGMSAKEQIAIISAISGAGEGAKNIIAQEAGVRDREITEGVTEAMAANLLLAGAINIIAKTMNAPASKKREIREIVQSTSKQDEQIVINQANDLANAGLITPEEGQYVLDQIQAQKVRDEKLPPGISKDDGVRVKAQDIVEQIEQLEAKKESVPKALHDEINQKIEDLKVKMKELKPEEDVEVEVKTPEVKVKETVIPDKIERHEDADLILDEIFKLENEPSKMDRIITDEKGISLEEKNIPTKEKEIINKAASIFNSIYPDGEFKIIDNAEDFAKASGSDEGSGGTWRNVGNKIYLNREMIDKYDAPETAAHEVIHPILYEAGQGREGMISEMYSLIEKSYKDDPSAKGVWEHENFYKPKDALGRPVKETNQLAKNEVVVEFITKVADGTIDPSKIKKELITKIIEYVNIGFEKLGIKYRISTASDLRSLSDAIKKSFDTGDPKYINDVLGGSGRSKIDTSRSIIMSSIKEGKPNLYNKVKEVISKSVNSTDEQLITSLKRHLPEDEARALVEEVRGVAGDKNKSYIAEQTGFNEKESGQLGSNKAAKVNSEKVQYNGQDAIGNRSRPESDKASARDAAKQKISNPATNASLKAANAYNKSAGLPEVKPHPVKKSDPVLQPKIAEKFNELQDVNSPDYKETQAEVGIYEAYKAKYPDLIAKNNIKNYRDLVIKAYEALIKEVQDQYDSLPVAVDYHSGDKNYENSAEMLDDVHNYNHIWVYKGGDDHTMLGSSTRDADGLTANDKFRAVHDYYGHSIDGFQFGKDGEENAWIEHSKMFSKLAQIALSSETRGQNSVVNFSGINEVPLQKIKLGAALKKEGNKTGNKDMIAEGERLISEANNEFNYAEQKSVALPPDMIDAEKHFSKEATPVKTKGAKVILPESNKKPNIVEPIKKSADERKEKGEEVLSGTPETKQAGVEKDSASATNITHAEVERRRAEMGMDEYVKEKKSMSELGAEVDEMIAKNPNALNDLLSDLESGNKTSTSPAEQLLMNRRAQELIAMIEKDPGNKALEKLYDRLTNVTNVQRSETGRALGMFTNTDPTSSYAEMRNYAKKSRGVDRLTEAEEAELKQQYEAIEKDRDDFEAKVAELEAARLKDEAEKAILTEKLKLAQEAKKAQKAQKKADTKKEKEQTIADMKKAIRDAGKQTYATLPYLPQVLAAAPYVAKYAKILVKEGIDQLEDIVANIKTTLQDDIPDIQDRDIIDILGGRYDKKKETANDLQARINELKTEARLVGELEDILSGKEPPKTEKAKRAKNKRIAELKERIKALTKDKEVRDAVVEEDADTKIASKLKTLKTTYDKKLKEVEERLKNKDFVNKKRIPVLEDKEIKESQPELFKQAEDAAIAYRKKKKDFMVEQLKYELENDPKYSKGAEMVKGVQGLARELQSTGDFSAVLRQGLILSITRPKLAARALKDMFKATKSKKYFEDWYAKLEDTELWDLAVKKSKLSLADPSDPRLLAREDIFMGGGLAGHIPLFGRVVRGSERAYTMYLNSIRLSAFEVAAKNLMNDGKTFDSNPELFKGWARYINAATGRGNLGEFGEKSTLAFSTILYSPRLVASRLELLGLTDIVSYPFPSVTKGFYRSLPANVRNRAFIDMATSIAAGSMGLVLAKWMGADVETDPRSTDFGKIKVGETRYDIWAGLQPFVRTFAQILTNSYVNSKGKEVSLNKGYGQKDAENTYTKFWRNKLAPVPSLAASLIFRKDGQGNKVIFDWDEPGKYEVNAEDLVLNTFLPLSNEEWADIFKDPSMQNAMDILVSLFGVGVNQYDREETRKVKPLVEIVTGSKEK